MVIDYILKIIVMIGALGTAAAAIAAWRTLKEIKRQRISAQKPQILFSSGALGKIDITDISRRVPIFWYGGNEFFEDHVFFEMINGGEGIAKNIVFEYKLDIEWFIYLIENKDTDGEINISVKDGWLIISSKSKIIDENIFISVNRGPSDRLEYLLTRTVQEKPSGFSIPKEYLILNSCLLYLSNQHDFEINIEKIPKIYVKTSFEDVSGNLENLFHTINTFYFKEGKFDFSLKKIRREDYAASHAK